jgi:hypothetical protein
MKTTTVQVNELSAAALDWAVLKSIGGEADDELTHSRKVWGTWGDLSIPEHFSPSYDWSQGGPLISRFEINIRHCKPFLMESWIEARTEIGKGTHLDSELIAVCRAVVAHKYGDTVEIPSELLEVTP